MPSKQNRCLLACLLAVGVCGCAAEKRGGDASELRPLIEQLIDKVDKLEKRLETAAPGIPPRTGAECDPQLAACRAALKTCEQDPFTGTKYFTGADRPARERSSNRSPRPRNPGIFDNGYESIENEK